MTPEEKALVLEAARIMMNLANLVGTSDATPKAVIPEPYRAVANNGPAWVCPIHGGSRIVPAGFSQRLQRQYNAFLACSAPGCDSRPPRNGPVSPVEPRRATNYPEVVPESTRGLTELP